MNTEDEKSKEIEFTDELDLHHFASRDTGFLVEYFIREAQERGVDRVRIIHGKGRSAKKREVYALLDRNQRVQSYGDDGHNWGSTVVVISPKTD
ncbi:MAG TPA: Smr/MutS family protein [Spirochaetota bacterium]